MIDLGLPAIGKNSRDAELRALLLQTARGSSAAFAEFRCRTDQRTASVAAAILADPWDVEEAVEDTFLRVWIHAHSYDAERGSASGWLFFIARNCAVQVRRDRRQIMSIDIAELDESESPVQPPQIEFDSERTSSVRYALTALDTARRSLIDMAFFQDFTYPEIAARTGMPLGTVKSTVRRSLATMRRALADSTGSNA